MESVMDALVFAGIGSDIRKALFEALGVNQLLKWVLGLVLAFVIIMFLLAAATKKLRKEVSIGGIVVAIVIIVIIGSLRAPLEEQFKVVEEIMLLPLSLSMWHGRQRVSASGLLERLRRR